MAEHKYINANCVLFDKEESINGDIYQKISGTDSKTEKDQLLKQQEEILQRTLQISNHTLGLQEIEDIGIETAKQLNHQGDQLKNVNCNLDKMKANLDVSQQRINSMSSLFKKAKNYFKSDETKEVKALEYPSEMIKKPTELLFNKHLVPTEHTTSQQISTLTGPNKDLNDMVDSNTIQIYNSAVKLKEIAIAMGKEIEEQDIILDAIKEKAERAEIKIGCQTKQITKLLKK